MNIKKLISMLTMLCFLFSSIGPDIASASLAVGNQQTAEKSTDFVPVNLGRVIESRSFDGCGYTVVNIQDLHCHTEVQKNISSIIANLKENHNVSAVFAEGGYERIDTGVFKAIADEKLRDSLIEALINKGRLTGTEYFFLKNESEIPFFGLEDKDIHTANLKRLSEIADNKKAYKETLSKIKNEIEYLKAKNLSFENKKFNKFLDDYKEGNVLPQRYYSLLKKYINKINRDERKYNSFLSVSLEKYPIFDSYCALLKNSKEINFEKAMQEMQVVVGELRSILSYGQYNELSLKTAGFSNVEELSLKLGDMAREYGLRINENSSLARLMHYVRANKMLNPVVLLQEERRIIEDIRVSFSNSPTEVEISFLSDFYTYLESFLYAEITSDDYDFFASEYEQFEKTYKKYAYKNHLAELGGDIAFLKDYYEINKNRNEIFIKNIEKNVNSAAGENNLVIVVTGGFHSEGLNKLFSRNGISYISVMPSITRSSAESDDNYYKFVKNSVIFNSQTLALGLASQAQKPEIAQIFIETAAAELSNITFDETSIAFLMQNISNALGEALPYSFNNDTVTVKLSNGSEIVLKNNNGKIEPSAEMSVAIEQNSASFDLNGTAKSAAGAAALSQMPVFSPNTYKTVKHLMEFAAKNNMVSADGLIFDIEMNPDLGDKIDNIDKEMLARMPAPVQKAALNYQNRQDAAEAASARSSFMRALLTAYYQAGLDGSALDYFFVPQASISAEAVSAQAQEKDGIRISLTELESAKAGLSFEEEIQRDLPSTKEYIRDNISVLEEYLQRFIDEGRTLPNFALRVSAQRFYDQSRENYGLHPDFVKHADYYFQDGGNNYAVPIALNGFNKGFTLYRYMIGDTTVEKGEDINSKSIAELFIRALRNTVSSSVNSFGYTRAEDRAAGLTVKDTPVLMAINYTGTVGLNRVRGTGFRDMSFHYDSGVTLEPDNALFTVQLSEEEFGVLQEESGLENNTADFLYLKFLAETVNQMASAEEKAEIQDKVSAFEDASDDSASSSRLTKRSTRDKIKFFKEGTKLYEIDVAVRELFASTFQPAEKFVDSHYKKDAVTDEIRQSEEYQRRLQGTKDIQAATKRGLKSGAVIGGIAAVTVLSAISIFMPVSLPVIALAASSIISLTAAGNASIQNIITHVRYNLENADARLRVQDEDVLAKLKERVKVQGNQQLTINDQMLAGEEQIIVQPNSNANLFTIAKATDAENKLVITLQKGKKIEVEKGKTEQVLLDKKFNVSVQYKAGFQDGKIVIANIVGIGKKETNDIFVRHSTANMDEYKNAAVPYENQRFPIEAKALERLATHAPVPYYFLLALFKDIVYSDTEKLTGEEFRSKIEELINSVNVSDQVKDILKDLMGNGEPETIKTKLNDAFIEPQKYYSYLLALNGLNSDEIMAEIEKANANANAKTQAKVKARAKARAKARTKARARAKARAFALAKATVKIKAKATTYAQKLVNIANSKKLEEQDKKSQLITAMYILIHTMDIYSVFMATENNDKAVYDQDEVAMLLDDFKDLEQRVLQDFFPSSLRADRLKEFSLDKSKKSSNEPIEIVLPSGKKVYRLSNKKALLSLLGNDRLIKARMPVMSYDSETDKESSEETMIFADAREFDDKSYIIDFESKQIYGLGEKALYIDEKKDGTVVVSDQKSPDSILSITDRGEKEKGFVNFTALQGKEIKMKKKSAKEKVETFIGVKEIQGLAYELPKPLTDMTPEEEKQIPRYHPQKKRVYEYRYVDKYLQYEESRYYSSFYKNIETDQKIKQAIAKGFNDMFDLYAIDNRYVQGFKENGLNAILNMPIGNITIQEKSITVTVEDVLKIMFKHAVQLQSSETDTDKMGFINVLYKSDDERVKAFFFVLNVLKGMNPDGSFTLPGRIDSVSSKVYMLPNLGRLDALKDAASRRSQEAADNQAYDADKQAYIENIMHFFSEDTYKRGDQDRAPARIFSEAKYRHAKLFMSENDGEKISSALEKYYMGTLHTFKGEPFPAFFREEKDENGSVEQSYLIIAANSAGDKRRFAGFIPDKNEQHFFESYYTEGLRWINRLNDKLSDENVIPIDQLKEIENSLRLFRIYADRNAKSYENEVLINNFLKTDHKDLVESLQNILGTTSENNALKWNLAQCFEEIKNINDTKGNVLLGILQNEDIQNMIKERKYENLTQHYSAIKETLKEHNNAIKNILKDLENKVYVQKLIEKGNSPLVISLKIAFKEFFDSLRPDFAIRHSAPVLTSEEGEETLETEPETGAVVIDFATGKQLKARKDVFENIADKLGLTAPAAVQGATIVGAGVGFMAAAQNIFSFIFFPGNMILNVIVGFAASIFTAAVTGAAANIVTHVGVNYRHIKEQIALRDLARYGVQTSNGDISVPVFLINRMPSNPEEFGFENSGVKVDGKSVWISAKSRSIVIFAESENFADLEAAVKNRNRKINEALSQLIKENAGIDIKPGTIEIDWVNIDAGQEATSMTYDERGEIRLSLSAQDSQFGADLADFITGIRAVQSADKAAAVQNIYYFLDNLANISDLSSCLDDFQKIGNGQIILDYGVLENNLDLMSIQKFFDTAHANGVKIIADLTYSNMSAQSCINAGFDGYLYADVTGKLYIHDFLLSSKTDANMVENYANSAELAQRLGETQGIKILKNSQVVETLSIGDRSIIDRLGFINILKGSRLLGILKKDMYSANFIRNAAYNLKEDYIPSVTDDELKAGLIEALDMKDAERASGILGVASNHALSAYMDKIYNNVDNKDEALLRQADFLEAVTERMLVRQTVAGTLVNKGFEKTLGKALRVRLAEELKEDDNRYITVSVDDFRAQVKQKYLDSGYTAKEYDKEMKEILEWELDREVKELAAKAFAAKADTVALNSIIELIPAIADVKLNIKVSSENLNAFDVRKMKSVLSAA